MHGRPLKGYFISGLTISSYVVSHLLCSPSATLRALVTWAAPTHRRRQAHKRQEQDTFASQGRHALPGRPPGPTCMVARIPNTTRRGRPAENKLPYNFFIAPPSPPGSAYQIPRRGRPCKRLTILFSSDQGRCATVESGDH